MMFFLKKASIRSKLQAILLLVCLLSILITGYVGYASARKALNSSIYEGLTALRVRQANEIESYYARVQQEVLSFSESPVVVDAFRAFKPAFQKLESQALNPTQLNDLKDVYIKQIFPKLGNTQDAASVVDSYLPQENAGRYLQYQYLAKNPFPIRSKYQLNDAKDGSDYSKAHAIFHPRFKRIIQLFDYYDIFLIDGATGNIIYNVSKEIDFATNLKTGNYSDTNLGNAFKEVLKSKDPNFTTAVDFEIYRPSYDSPAAFIATTIFDGTEFLGSLVFQISIDRINQNMTVNGKWREVGLQETGQSFLVGRDYTLRSEPRTYIENPDLFFERLRKRGTSQETIDKIYRTGTPILFAEMKHPLVEKALNGKSGTETSKDNTGKGWLVSYQPVQLGPFSWALATTMDEVEAFKPIHDFTRRLLITAAILLPAVALLSNWLSGLFTRPIARLVEGTRRIAGGETDVKVNITSQDELGELGQSFNQMSHSLHAKEQNLQEKLEENERLLLNILPPGAVKRMQEGEREFADTYKNVTLIYAEVEGFSELAATVDPEESVKLLNELMGAFDETAETYGIEKLKTIGTDYIAVCGLSIPRVDHAKRAVDFSIALLKTVQRFRTTHNTNVTLDIGVHSGEVVGGIVGKSKFIYELWGNTMKIVHSIHSSPDVDVIQVTEPVVNSLDQIYQFKPLDPIMVKRIGLISIWELKLPEASTVTVKGGEN